MDKNAIKKYAVWARNELIARVTQKAEQYEITEKKITPKDADSINGRLLTDTEKSQRKALIEKIQADGFEQVMKEVAYTWFNRFTALRFMEVNNYLPTQILADAIQLDLEGLDMDKVFELKDANKTEELYKYLLITQCNALSSVLPKMFQKIEHYTELLLPDYLLREGSVIEQMIALIPEEDWTDQVQIIGWLYQYYNSEPKDAVFAALKKNVKISKENIPAATQLFTPDWIVRYMVENSLGRLWLDGHPNDSLKSEWKYYLDEAKQEADAQKQLEKIRREYAELKPEDIRCIDPCMGSGHILCYMFDVLIKIYEDYGYTAREAVENIIEKNLWGLDLDDRAAQLSYFAVMMKARQYDRRFFNKKDDNGELCIPQPHVYAIEESNGITSAPMHDMGIGLSQEEYGKAVKEAMRLVDEMQDAKEFGSLIHITPCDWGLLRRFAVPRGLSEGQLMLDIHGEIEASERLQKLINIGEALSQRYHAVVTNPPYMGASGMSAKLAEFAKRSYSDSKSDLFAMFIERIKEMVCKNGFQGMITQHAWMFLTSFEKLRSKISRVDTVNMIHLGARAFEEIGGEVVQTTSFVFRNSNIKDYNGIYVRLLDPSSQQGKEDMFLAGNNRFVAKNSNFEKVPGSPIAYWISENYIRIFDNKTMSDYGNSCIGMRTGDNARFLRFWFEISGQKFGIGYSSAEEALKSKKKWFPYCKGGSFRKWYGNNEYLVNWENDGFEIKENTRKVYPYLGDNLGWKISNENYYFHPGLTWSGVGARVFGVRSYPQGMIFDSGANSFFVSDEQNYYYFAGLLNCVIMNDVINVINPTINTGCGVIAQLPAKVDKNAITEVTEIVKECIKLSKEDWDSFEYSWDFKTHPFVAASREVEDTHTIERAFEVWSKKAEKRFYRLKENEEHLNKLFLNIYGLGEELPANVEEGDVTVRKADLKRDVRSFISYAIGCMFGRYSLEKDGLIFTGGNWDASQYNVFQPDKDAIIPICDDEYFDDDAVGLFVEFVATVFGKESLEINLRFIADALGGKGTPREVIRSYFLNDFYNDHLKTYQKRPIYWLFDSGKKNGFKCLVYMHRYQQDTIARIRTDYVHEQQSRYRTAIAELENRINNSASSERVKLNKQLILLQAQATETREYEEKIHHLADQMISINLDDGVKHNYEIFKDVLAKIK